MKQRTAITKNQKGWSQIVDGLLAIEERDSVFPRYTSGR